MVDFGQFERRETGLNIERLKQTFDLIAPHGDTLVETFYQYLFADYPTVKPLFASAGMKQQKEETVGFAQVRAIL